MPHLRGLDHHLGGEAAGGVEDLVASRRCRRATSSPAIASTALWRPTSSTNIRISPAVRGERAAVHRAGLLVDRLVLAHRVEQLVERLARVSVTSSRSWIVSISSIRSPNTVPWPQPVVDGALLRLRVEVRERRCAS